MRRRMARRSPKKAEFPLLAHIDELMAKLGDLVPEAFDTFDVEAVHAARVTTRRLSAALDLLNPVLSKRHRKPVAAGLRHLRKRLGPLRDADVLVGHTADLAKDEKLASAAGWLAVRLEAGRDDLRRETKASVSAKRELRRTEAWPAVRGEVAEARSAVDSLLAESLHLQVDAFAEQADRLAENLRAAAAPAVDPHRQDPHALRIAGKALRYTLEMAAAEGRSPGSAVAKTFKRLQDQLGAWHDHVVLADRALQEVVESELAHHDPAAAEQMLDLVKVVVRRSARDLEAFAKLWSQQGAGLAAKIRAAFPLTRPLDFGPAETAAGASGAAGQSADVTADEPTASAPPTESGTGPDRSGSGGLEGPAAAPSEGTPAA
jgi:CHAD domain-containing protein